MTCKEGWLGSNEKPGLGRVFRIHQGALSARLRSAVFVHVEPLLGDCLLGSGGVEALRF